MTVQTKHFIELSDIVALRLECKKCGTTLTSLVGDKIDARALRVCPQCSEPWASLPGGSTIELELLKLVAALKETRAAVDARAQLIRDGGFFLSLEIKPDAIPKA